MEKIYGIKCNNYTKIKNPKNGYIFDNISDEKRF